MKICVVGLGYVGLPLAVKFGMKEPVNAFDINESRVNELKEGHDRTNEVTSDELSKTQITYSTDPEIISESDFIIIAVPTPIDQSKNPNLKPLLGASTTVGKHLKKGAIIVYESTVYPGCTEEDCIPILEKESGLKCGTDFKVGYSPERINPGDKNHTVEKIIKVVSGMDEESLNTIAETYEKIITAGVHRASSIKVAEAAKVIENTQRDINIAIMNELLVIFDKLNIKTSDVLKAAGTKWNFGKYHPGLVGGHCIGVDPYYLAYKATKVGHNPELILSGRRINNGMADYLVQKALKQLLKLGKENPIVAILGLTFKPNVPDVRNSQAKNVINKLKEYGINVIACDPLMDDQSIQREFNIPNSSIEEASKADLMILLSRHEEFERLLQSNNKPVVELYEQ